MGEVKSALWGHVGDGWTRYPKVKDDCKPLKVDDNTFWMGKDEFFAVFKNVHLCALDMASFGAPVVARSPDPSSPKTHGSASSSGEDSLDKDAILKMAESDDDNNF